MVAYSGLISLFALLIWPLVAGLVWLVRRRTSFVAELREPTPGIQWRALAVALATVSTVFTLWVGLGFIGGSTARASFGGSEIGFDVPNVPPSPAPAPIVLAALAAVLAIATILGWRRRWWSIPGLLLFTVIAANAVLFVAILVHRGYFPVVVG